jgi:hypothetical protein
MKKIFALILFACTIASIPAYSQINLISSYNPEFIYYVHFYSSGFKLVSWNDTSQSIIVYNLDNSVYKTIPVVLPSDYNGSNYSLFDISEGLFETDSLHMSYLLAYTTKSNIVNTVIYNEAGDILFKRDSFVPVGTVYGISNGSDFPIAETDSGAILRLTNSFQETKFEIYKLPGHLPINCNCNCGGSPSNVPAVNSPEGYGMNAQPNPANNSTKVYYTFPKGIHSGILKFYSANGIFVKEFNVTDAFNYILVSTANLPSGSYFYKIVTNEGVSQGQAIVVVH